MRDSEKGEYSERFLEPEFEITEDINGIRDGITDIRKGVASLFLKQNEEGTKLVGDGIHYIQESVSHMRGGFMAEDPAQSEACALALSGIETELEAVALLKEGLRDFQENHFAQGTQNIVQGLFLAENGLKDIAEGGKDFDQCDRRKVIMNLRRNVGSLQAAMGDIAEGLDDIQADCIEVGVKTIEAATEALSAVLERIEDDIQLLCDEEPEHLRLIIEGIQAVEEGRANIRLGLSAIHAPKSGENCPICLCIEQTEKALSTFRDGMRDMKRGMQRLQQDKAPGA